MVPNPSSITHVLPRIWVLLFFFEKINMLISVFPISFLEYATEPTESIREELLDA